MSGDPIVGDRIGRISPTRIALIHSATKAKLSFYVTLRTGSAAEMFAALMRDAVSAPIIGARTFGLGCGFMAGGAPIVLPHSRLEFQVPNCVRLRSDGTDEVAGIGADLPITARSGESPRARALRLLQTAAMQRAETAGGVP